MQHNRTAEGPRASRRDFLKGAGILGAVAAGTAVLSGCATDTPAAADTKVTWDKEVDILVIGGGVGGTFAGYVAGKGNAKTLVVEAGKELGGTALISSGSIHSGSVMDASEVEEKLPTGDHVLDRAYLESFKVIYDTWLVDTGAPCEKTEGRLSVSFGGADFSARQAFFKFFENELSGMGVEMLFNTRGARLIADDKGTIIGAQLIVPADGTVIMVGAKQTILACGSYTNNLEMREKYWGPWADRLTLRSVPHNTGDGLLMAIEHGAQLSRGHGWFYGHVEAWPPLVPEDPVEFENYDKGLARDLLAAIQTFSPRGIYVNKEGARFCNENGAPEIGGRFCEYILRQTGGVCYLVMDSSNISAYQASIDMLNANGLVYDKSDTLEGLADLLVARGVNKNTLLRTIDEVRNASNPALLVPPKSPVQDYIIKFDTPPYHAMQLTGSPSACFGGVKINTKGQVIGRADQPIPGLFATACTAGGFFYNEYGGSLGASATFGKISAETALTLL